MIGVVMHMDEDKFKILSSILKSIENRDLSKAELERTIEDIIADFDAEMSEEQRKEILKELFRYAKTKQKRKKLDELWNDENYLLNIRPKDDYV